MIEKTHEILIEEILFFSEHDVQIDPMKSMSDYGLSSMDKIDVIFNTMNRLAVIVELDEFNNARTINDVSAIFNKCLER